MHCLNHKSHFVSWSGKCAEQIFYCHLPLNTHLQCVASRYLLRAPANFPGFGLGSRLLARRGQKCPQLEGGLSHTFAIITLSRRTWMHLESGPYIDDSLGSPWTRFQCLFSQLVRSLQSKGQNESSWRAPDLGNVMTFTTLLACAQQSRILGVILLAVLPCSLDP